jgi:hypothetical protein
MVHIVTVGVKGLMRIGNFGVDGRITLKCKLLSTYLVAKFVLIQRVSDC